MIELQHGDCLEIMPSIPDKSIDMILADLPYGTTACKWDSVIPFEPLWRQYERIIKDNGAIVLTASQPFTSALVMSKPKLFKCEWIWEKDCAVNFIQAKNHPLKYHENIIVFGSGKITYNPIKWDSGRLFNKRSSKSKKAGFLSNEMQLFNKETSTYRFPSTIQKFSKPKHNSKEGALHPTQKPVSLMEYLILTYTNECEVVMDNCMGSGTTGVACFNTSRKFIGIEKDKNYFEIAKQRIDENIHAKRSELFD